LMYNMNLNNMFILIVSEAIFKIDRNENMS